MSLYVGWSDKQCHVLVQLRRSRKCLAGIEGLVTDPPKRKGFAPKLLSQYLLVPVQASLDIEHL